MKKIGKHSNFILISMIICVIMMGICILTTNTVLNKICFGIGLVCLIVECILRYKNKIDNKQN